MVDTHRMNRLIAELSLWNSVLASVKDSCQDKAEFEIVSEIERLENSLSEEKRRIVGQIAAILDIIRDHPRLLKTLREIVNG